MYQLRCLLIRLLSVFIIPITLTLTAITALVYCLGSKEVKVGIITQRNLLLKNNPLWLVITLVTLQIVQYANIYWLIKG